MLGDAATGTQVAPEARRIGMVFQDYALFPHLSVADNVAFGVQRPAARRARAARVQQMLDLVGLAHAAKRAPHQLSGGQQQRIALARALAPQPRLLLLDEPFSNLDVDLRERLAHEVRGILKNTGTTALFVTHDQLEAFALGDVIGVMQRGRLEQWDDAYALYHRPATRFVAALHRPRRVHAGAHRPRRGRRAGGCVHTALGALDDLQECPLPDAYPGGDCDVLLRADDIVHDDASPVKACIERKAFRGSEFLYTLRLASGEQVLAHVPSHHDHQVGEWIGIRAEVDHVVTFAARNVAPGPRNVGRATFPWLHTPRRTGVLYWHGICTQQVWSTHGRQAEGRRVIALGALAGALATIQLQAFARARLAPLPLEELQQLAAVFGMVKSDYVEPVDEKKLISDAISGMVAGLDPHSQYFDKKTLKEFREQTGGRFVGVGIEIGMEDGLVKVQSPDRRLAGLPRRHQDRRPDHPHRRHRRQGPDHGPGRQAHARRAQHQGLADHLPQEREPHLPGDSSRARKSACRACARKILEPGYAWLRVSQFQDRTVDDFVRKLEEIYKQEPNLKGLVLDLRNDPGGLLDARGGHLGRLPARERGGRHHQRPDRRIEGHLQGRARVLCPPRRRRPAEAPAGRREDGAAGGAGQRRLGLGQRDRRRRAAGPQARHHHGRADLRQGLGADRAPAVGRHRAEDHHRALLHAVGPARSRPRASCPTSGSTKPPKATSSPRCACARPIWTST